MDNNLATNWNAWKKAWTRYEVATGINRQEQLVRVPTCCQLLERTPQKHSMASNWEKPKVRFMGHTLTPEGLKPDPAKVEAITAMPEPDNVTALKCFLGMVNY